MVLFFFVFFLTQHSHVFITTLRWCRRRSVQGDEEAGRRLPEAGTTADPRELDKKCWSKCLVSWLCFSVTNSPSVDQTWPPGFNKHCYIKGQELPAVVREKKQRGSQRGMREWRGHAFMSLQPGADKHGWRRRRRGGGGGRVGDVKYDDWCCLCLNITF